MRKLKTGQLAQRVGLHSNTIRKLEKQGLIKAERSISGYRIFDERAIGEIFRIYERRRLNS